MRIAPRGYEGVQQRMQEIRSKLEQAFPKSHIGEIRKPQGGLNGSIGAGGFEPLNPYGPGLSAVPALAPERLAGMIASAAAEAGVDPALFDALVAAESSYDPNARSRAGALGLSQLMPDTAASLGVQNPFDPAQNLRGGATYLAQMLDRFGGDPQMALAAYNAGPGAVEKHGGVPPYAETRAYIDRVLKLYEVKRGGS
jgi:soluble lytic murein transglycosylase-like protein